MPLTRLAPSPTGALHLGNARTFLINYLLARQNGWHILLRIEDIDGPRIKPGADQLALSDLRWLGIDWDEGPTYQTARKPKYDAAIQHLIANGHTFYCTCSRKDIESAASAPHASDGSTIYPGTCRAKHDAPADGSPAALRFRAPNETISFNDAFAGPQLFNVPRQLGDFVVQKADGTPAYQLAVVVDDADASVTHIVRGDDLLDSTPRQILLYRALGLVGPFPSSNPQSALRNPQCNLPTYYHLPLIIGPDGRRLAKRHGDTRLETYRNLGVPPSRILELLARWSGITTPPRVQRAADLLESFRLDAVPKTPIVFTAADDAFLRTGQR